MTEGVGESQVLFPFGNFRALLYGGDREPRSFCRKFLELGPSQLCFLSLGSKTERNV